MYIFILFYEIQCLFMTRKHTQQRILRQREFWMKKTTNKWVPKRTLMIDWAEQNQQAKTHMTKNRTRKIVRAKNTIGSPMTTLH